MSHAATTGVGDRGIPQQAGLGGGTHIRLNVFQQLMRKWNTLAPYNAGQIMQVSGAGDMNRWRQAVESVVDRLGLGAPSEISDTEIAFEPVAEVPLERVNSNLEAHFSRELNRPFTAGEFPIRFFVLDKGDGTHWFGAVYDHWIADSRAMRDLMERIFACYRGVSIDQLGLLRLENPDFPRLYRHINGWLPRTAAIRESLRNLYRHRRGFRINLNEPLDFTAQFIYRPLPEGLIDRIHAYAKAHEASVNDAFLAVLGQTMGAYTAGQRYQRKRKFLRMRRDRIGLGTIVDIRDAAQQSLQHVFGLYLSCYTVVLEKPEKRTIASLMEEIGATTRRIKRTFATVKGFAALHMALRWWGLYSRPKPRALLFHKNVPNVAGISNVNMTGSWVDHRAAAVDPSSNGHSVPSGPTVLDYLRVSPTGPLLPLVFTLTTIGQRLSLCVTYRTTAFSHSQAEDIVRDFIQRLEEAVETRNVERSTKR